jgi:hypothetical protein
MSEIAGALAGDDGIYVYPPTDLAPFFAVLIRRETFAILKGFDERFTLYGQDHDMQERMRGMGLQTGALLSAPFWHGGSLSTKRACQHGEIHLQEEYVRIGQVLGPLREGALKRWHELSEFERAAVRLDRRFNRIATSRG